MQWAANLNRRLSYRRQEIMPTLNILYRLTPLSLLPDVDMDNLFRLEHWTSKALHPELSLVTELSSNHPSGWHLSIIVFRLIDNPPFLGLLLLLLATFWSVILLHLQVLLVEEVNVVHGAPFTTRCTWYHGGTTVRDSYWMPMAQSTHVLEQGQWPLSAPAAGFRLVIDR